MKRYELTKEQWERIKPLLPQEETGKRGCPRKDNRTMLNGMLWIVRSGAQWRELPAAYGPWQSVYARFSKWRDDGTLEAVFHALSGDADMENLSVDSTCVKVHESANDGEKQRIRRLAVPEVGGTQNSTRSWTVWETRWSSFSPLEMTTIRFTLLNYWKKSGSEGVPYWQTGHMVLGQCGNISQRTGPVM